MASFERNTHETRGSWVVQLPAAATAFACTLLLHPLPAAGSVVLVARTDSGIVVAADTRGSSTNPKTRPFPYCKVVASDDTVVAFVGLNGIPSLQVDVRELLREVLDRRLPYPDLLRALDQEMGTYLPALLDLTVRVVPEFTPFLERRRGFFFAMVVAGIEDGRPTWRIRRYMRSVGKDGRVRIRHRDSRCAERCLPGQTASLDGSGRVNRELRQLDPRRLEQDWAREARRIVGIAARESPSSIGLPAVSLALTPSGVTWLETHRVCSAPASEGPPRTADVEKTR